MRASSDPPGAVVLAVLAALAANSGEAERARARSGTQARDREREVILTPPREREQKPASEIAPESIPAPGRGGIRIESPRPPAPVRGSGARAPRFALKGDLT